MRNESLAYLQKQLTHLHQQCHLTGVLDALQNESLRLNYINAEQLKINKHYSFYDAEYQLTFKAQVNIARSQYVPDLDNTRKSACLICYDNVYLKPKLRVYEFSLNSKTFFVQATPFPLYSHHFVVISRDHRPMHMNSDSVSDLCSLADDLPGYTLCSNSDIAWAGASILDHHHYQVIRALDLPIFNAKASTTKMLYHENALVQVESLHYPILSKRVTSHNKLALVHIAAQIIDKWKQQIPGKNTCNLALMKCGEEYQLTIIFRNSDFRTRASLQHIKREGVGVLEVAGIGIYPEPQGDAAPSIWQQLTVNGLTVIKDIISDNNPYCETIGFL